MKHLVNIAVCCAQAVAALCCFVIFPKVFFVASCIFIKFRDRIEARLTKKPPQQFSHCIRFPSTTVLQKGDSKFAVISTISKKTPFTSTDIQCSKSFCEHEMHKSIVKDMKPSLQLWTKSFNMHHKQETQAQLLRESLEYA